VTWAGAGLDVTLGLALLYPAWRMRVAVTQLALLAIYTVLATVALPMLWADPFGPLLTRDHTAGHRNHHGRPRRIFANDAMASHRHHSLSADRRLLATCRLAADSIQERGLSPLAGRHWRACGVLADAVQTPCQLLTLTQGVGLGTRRSLFTEPYPHSDAVFCHERNATGFESMLYRLQRALPWMDGIVLDHVQGHGREASPLREGCLGPFQQAARRADLGGADHGDTL
jgi:hypothetical protein